MWLLYLLGFCVLCSLISNLIGWLANKIGPSETEKYCAPFENQFKKNNVKPIQYRTPNFPKIKLSSENNMNYDNYVFSAKSSKTHRIHKARTIVVMDGENPEDCIRALGYEDPMYFEKIEFPLPSSSQEFEYLRLAKLPLPENASSEDAKALIERYIYEPNGIGKDLYSPHQELVTYATNKKIHFSYYIGKKHLYQLIFNSLTTEDKIVFYIFCVYKDIMQKRGITISRNPELCDQYNCFCEFSKLILTDSEYVNSLKKIDGHTLRFFGEYNYNGKTLYGASTTTPLYKEAVNFLTKRDCI